MPQVWHQPTCSTEVVCLLFYFVPEYDLPTSYRSTTYPYLRSRKCQVCTSTQLGIPPRSAMRVVYTVVPGTYYEYEQSIMGGLITHSFDHSLIRCHADHQEEAVVALCFALCRRGDAIASSKECSCRRLSPSSITS